MSTLREMIDVPEQIMGMQSAVGRTVHAGGPGSGRRPGGGMGRQQITQPRINQRGLKVLLQRIQQMKDNYKRSKFAGDKKELNGLKDSHRALMRNPREHRVDTDGNVWYQPSNK